MRPSASFIRSLLSSVTYAQRPKNASLCCYCCTTVLGWPVPVSPTRWRPDPGQTAVTSWRPLLGGRPWSRRARSGHDTQLHEEAEHVRPTPMLSLLAVLHPEEVDPVDHGLLARRGDADKLVLVGAGVGHPGGHQLPLGDHVVDLGVQVGKGLLNR